MIVETVCMAVQRGISLNSVPPAPAEDAVPLVDVTPAIKPPQRVAAPQPRIPIGLPAGPIDHLWYPATPSPYWSNIPLSDGWWRILPNVTLTTNGTSWVST